MIVKTIKKNNLKRVSGKMKEYRLTTKKALLIATNLASICWVYTEKMLRTTTKIENVAIYDLDRKKNQFIFKQIIQILQPLVIDYFSPHLYIVNFS